MAAFITYLCTVIKKLPRADKVVSENAAATAAGEAVLNEAAVTENEATEK